MKSFSYFLKEEYQDSESSFRILKRPLHASKLMKAASRSEQVKIFNAFESIFYQHYYKWKNPKDLANIFSKSINSINVDQAIKTANLIVNSDKPIQRSNELADAFSKWWLDLIEGEIDPISLQEYLIKEFVVTLTR
jgi:hypothetical protein